MSEDDWEPDLESEEEPPSDDESRGQSDGAGSSMGSDGSENEDDWQAGSELHRHAGTHNLWLVEYHTTGDKVRQARLKTGASYPDPSREDSDSKRHADQELTALRIEILEKRRSDSAQAHSDPEAARRLLKRDEKELRDFDFSFGTFRKNIECQDPGDLRTRMDARTESSPANAELHVFFFLTGLSASSYSSFTSSSAERGLCVRLIQSKTVGPANSARYKIGVNMRSRKSETLDTSTNETDRSQMPVTGL